MPAPVLEATEATNTAIKDRWKHQQIPKFTVYGGLLLVRLRRKECLEEGCSVDALMELDKKLAKDEDLRGRE